MNHTGVWATGRRRQASRNGTAVIAVTVDSHVVRRSIDDARDAHPEGDEDKAPASWMVQLLDDCEACDDLRVALTVEDVGGAGYGVVAHLDAAGARRLRGALADALREVGEDPGR
jgi:hypothetical protein